MKIVIKYSLKKLIIIYIEEKINYNNKDLFLLFKIFFNITISFQKSIKPFS